MTKSPRTNTLHLRTSLTFCATNRPAPGHAHWTRSGARLHPDDTDPEWHVHRTPDRDVHDLSAHHAPRDAHSGRGRDTPHPSAGDPAPIRHMLRPGQCRKIRRSVHPMPHPPHSPNGHRGPSHQPDDGQEPDYPDRPGPPLPLTPPHRGLLPPTTRSGAPSSTACNTSAAASRSPAPPPRPSRSADPHTTAATPTNPRSILRTRQRRGRHPPQRRLSLPNPRLGPPPPGPAPSTHRPSLPNPRPSLPNAWLGLPTARPSLLNTPAQPPQPPARPPTTRPSRSTHRPSLPNPRPSLPNTRPSLPNPRLGPPPPGPAAQHTGLASLTPG